MHEILQEILWSQLAKDELPVDDAEFDEEILDNLTIDPFSDVRGLIALFYAICGQWQI